MTIQIDAGQALVMAFSTLAGPVLTSIVQDWRRRRREQREEIEREAARAVEMAERNAQHEENKTRMDEMTRVLDAAFGANGRLGFLVHRQELQVLRAAHDADHVRLNGHATMIEKHNEQINGLRRDVDELRRS